MAGRRHEACALCEPVGVWAGLEKASFLFRWLVATFVKKRGPPHCVGDCGPQRNRSQLR